MEGASLVGGQEGGFVHSIVMLAEQADGQQA
jgi:hypothetical protein